jgi:hypothetical protein
MNNFLFIYSRFFNIFFIYFLCIEKNFHDKENKLKNQGYEFKYKVTQKLG